MAGKYKTFTLRWGIDNPAVKFVAGEAESDVFEEGGFRWSLTAKRDNDGRDVLSLCCGVGHNEPWRCVADVELRERNVNEGGRFVVVAALFCFTANRSCFVHEIRPSDSDANYRRDLKWKANDKIIVEYRINVIIALSLGGEPLPGQFAAPNRMSNVILKIGDKKLHVSKEYLAVHSPVFEILFFGDFAEKDKEEVELKNEFLDLLHFIYIGKTKITDGNVIHIMKLADQFQMERVFEQAKQHFTDSEKFDARTKFSIAVQYNSVDILDNFLQSFTSATELVQTLVEIYECNSSRRLVDLSNHLPPTASAMVDLLQPFFEYFNFSEKMKAAVCDRIMKLGLQ